MIEALACGTPVIAWRNGSVPEIIEDGRTGFIVDTMDEAVKAIAETTQLSRAACRASFEDRFDAACMASNYERVYRAAPGRLASSIGNCRIRGPAERGAGGLRA